MLAGVCRFSLVIVLCAPTLACTEKSEEAFASPASRRSTCDVLLVPSLQHSDIDPSPPWLQYMVRDGDGVKLRDEDGLAYEGGEEFLNREARSLIERGDVKLRAVTDWQWKSSVLIRSLEPGNYTFEVFLPGSVHPAARKSAVLSEALKIVPLDIGDPRSVRIKVAALPHGFGDRLLSKPWWIVMCDSSSANMASCIVTRGFWHDSEASAVIYANGPAHFEAFLVLELPGTKTEGKGMALKSVRLPATVASLDFVPVELATHQPEAVPLPEWLRASMQGRR